MEHFRSHPVDDAKCNFRSVVRRIDMDTERALANRRVYDLDDRISYVGCIGILRNDGGKSVLDFLSVAFMGSSFVLSLAIPVGGRAGMREVIGAARERAGHDDRCFDAPQRQLASVLHGKSARVRASIDFGVTYVLDVLNPPT